MQAYEPDTLRSIERRRSVRVPLSMPYRWEFRSRRGFFDGVASDLCEGGMFIRIANPQLEGSEVEFEVQFADGLPLIEGRGQVTWVCDRSLQPDRAPGMGIRFLDLLGDSREVVNSTVEARLRAL